MFQVSSAVLSYALTLQHFSTEILPRAAHQRVNKSASFSSRDILLCRDPESLLDWASAEQAKEVLGLFRVVGFALGWPMTKLPCFAPCPAVAGSQPLLAGEEGGCRLSVAVQVTSSHSDAD